MKQLFAIFALTLTAFTAQAQEATPLNNGNNDLKINALYGVLETLELEYERILNQNVSIGMAASYWFQETSEFDFIAIPYFRFYPSAKEHAEGFFIEANLAVIGSTDFYYDWTPNYTSYNEREVNVVSMGAGVAAGGKFVSKSGFFGEIFGGLGRVFNDESFLELYPRVGIALGKRFGR